MTHPAEKPVASVEENGFDPATEQRLESLLAQLLDQRRRGESRNIEDLARQNPDLADELQKLWFAAQVAEEMADGSRGEGSDELTTSGNFDRRPHLATHHFAEPLAQFGDYMLLRELGRGGMGVVFEAYQKSLDRTVAVKMMGQGAMASAADRARFRSEAESAAQLDHPNIVPIYQVGEHDGTPYFSMKLVRGVTLAARLANGPLPARESAELLLPVCRAIAEAHRSGVLHRDLKPSNILIDAERRPHVSDFGLAKRIDAGAGLTLSGAIVGTPSYMAPEQAAGARGVIGPASDVYSLGAVLYEMLTGRPPIKAATPLETILMVLEQDPLPPRLLNPAVDPDLEMIALQCLQKPPELRPRDAAALADDLAAYLSGEPIAARQGRLSQVLARLFRETHHAVILENWGLLWMWHSLALLVLCVTTNVMHLRGVSSPVPYLALWLVGLGAWAAIFWMLRRRAGPIMFVERQIAHIWGASVIASTMLFVVEMLLGLAVLTLSPVLGLINAMVFVVKAGILWGAFYFQAAALFATAIVMALAPTYGLTLFGIVSAACFFLPGLKYYRQALPRGRQ